MPHRKLTVEFLGDIAASTSPAGQDWDRRNAEARHVSPRTVVSWIEKARRAGILTPVRPGQFGGTFVRPAWGAGRTARSEVVGRRQVDACSRGLEPPRWG